MNRVITLILAVGIFSIGGILAVYYLAKPEHVDIEIIKSLLTILTAAVVIQAISIVVNQHNENRKNEQEKDKIRASALDRLNASFIAIKKVRRRIRGRSDIVKNADQNVSFIVTRELYLASMDLINDAQLGIEVIAKDIETNSSIFQQGLKIYDHVSSMEEYLNEIINEWEHSRADFSGTPPSTDVAALPQFFDFIGSYKGSKFSTQFVKPYYFAANLLTEALSHGRGWTWKVTPRTTSDTRDKQDISKV